MFSSVKSNTQALKNHYNLCTIIIKFCVTLQSVHVIKQNLFYAVMFVNLFFLRKWSCCDIIAIWYTLYICIFDIMTWNIFKILKCFELFLNLEKKWVLWDEMINI